MAVGHVRADDEEQVGAIEVGVGTGRAVGAEGLLVAGARAGHAQPRVRLDVHGAHEALGQFGGQILRLDGHLARHVQRDSVGAVLVDDRAQPPACLGDGVVDGRGHGFVAAGGPQQRRRQPAVVGGHHLGVRGALGAQPAEVGGVQLVPGHPRDDRAARRGVGLVSTSMPQPTPQYEHAVRVVHHAVSGRGTGAGGRGRCARRSVRRSCIRRNTTQVTMAQTT